MREQLLLLFELQQLDSKILAREAVLNEIPKEANLAKEELSKAQKTLSIAKARQDDAGRDKRRLEGELAAEKEKLRKWEARLNDIRNSREFAALSREIEALKRQNKDLEEKILAQMDSSEKTDAEINEISSVVDTLASNYEKLSTEANKASESVVVEVEEFRSHRVDILEKIHGNLVVKYDHIRRKRAGVAVVMVQEGTCQGCHMKLPPQLYNELQRGDKVDTCPSCLRILFWEALVAKEEEAQA